MIKIHFTQEEKVRFFKWFNKLVFYKVLRFHLPNLGPKGFHCAICDKDL